MNKLSLIVFLLLFSVSSYAFVSETGLDPLDQTGAARALGMGNAFVAVSDDINCLFYNPAGLSDSTGLAVNYGGLNNVSLGIAYGTPIGNFGMGYVSKQYDFSFGTVEASYEKSLLLMGYGTQIDSFSLGFSLKTLMYQRMVQTGINDQPSNAANDFDAGIIYKMNPYTSFGFTIHNLTSGNYKIGLSNEALPVATKYGLAVDLVGNNAFFISETYGLRAAWETESTKIDVIGTKQSSFLGFEGSFNGWLFVRTGLTVYDNNTGGSTYGFGVKNNDTSCNVALFKDPVTEKQTVFYSVQFVPPQLVRSPRSEKKVSGSARSKQIFTLIAPEDGLITYDENVNITGRADSKASILVNSVNVYLSDDGRFNALQPLLPGKNLIEIEGSLGQEKKIERRKVLKKAKVVIAEEQSLNKTIDDEIVKKEADLNKREDSLKKLKEKGIDVSMEEKKLNEERKNLETRKTELYGAKEKMKERKEKVENLVTLGVIEVSKDKSFAIETKITRGEMITWLVRAAELPIPRLEGPVFSDVPANNIYAPYIKAAFDAGMVKRPSDGKFRPNDPVTEKEGEAFFRAFGIVK